MPFLYEGSYNTELKNNIYKKPTWEKPRPLGACYPHTFYFNRTPNPTELCFQKRGPHINTGSSFYPVYMCMYIGPTRWSSYDRPVDTTAATTTATTALPNCDCNVRFQPHRHATRGLTVRTECKAHNEGVEGEREKQHDRSNDAAFSRGPA